MSLRTSIGAIGNLLGERPEDCRRVEVPSPVLDRRAVARLRELDARVRRDDAVHALPPWTRAPPGWSARSTRCCRAASRAGLGRQRRSSCCPTAASTPSTRRCPALLATAAVHSHLVREGARTMCGLVVESGEPRETMHFALLLGYGAAAVHPYLALDGLRRRPGGAGYLGAVGAAACSRCARRWGSRPSRATAAPRSSRRSASAAAWSTATSRAPSPGSAGSGMAELHAARSPGCTRAPSGRRARRVEHGGEYRLPAGRRASRLGPGGDRPAPAGGPRRQPRDASRPTPSTSTPPAAPRRSAACSSRSRPARRAARTRSSRPPRSSAGSPPAR